MADMRDADAEANADTVESAELMRREEQALRAARDHEQAADDHARAMRDREQAADDRTRAAEERAESARDRSPGGA